MSNITLPTGQQSLLVTPVDKDGVTTFVTPVDFNGNIISGGGGSPGGSDTQVQFNDAGSFGGDSGLTYNKTTDTLTAGSVTSTIFTALPANNTSALVASGSSLTGSNAQSLVNLSQTWNTTGTPTAIFANITDTASNINSRLIDLQVSGSSIFSIRKSGAVVSFNNGVGNPTFDTSNFQTMGTLLIGAGGIHGQTIRIQPRATSNGENAILCNTRINFRNSADSALTDIVCSSIFIQDTILNRDAANVLAQRNGVNSQTSRLYKSYTDASNYTRAAWQFDANGIVLAGESAGTGDANIGFSFGIKGTGAFQLQQTDSTATGGNARGINAVDLQMSRTLATQVSSGSYSFIAGLNNTAGGTGSFAMGNQNGATGQASIALGTQNGATGAHSLAVGYLNTASNNSAIALGFVNIASGYSSIALGQLSTTKSVESLLAIGSGVLALGKSQLNQLVLGVATTNDTPAVLRSNSSAAAATNQLVLQNNSALYVEGLVIANVTGAGDTSSWKITATIKRGANAASTALVGTPTVTVAHQDAGASGWVVAVTADTTNGTLAVTVTGQAATTIRWTCTLFASEVAF